MRVAGRVAIGLSRGRGRGGRCTFTNTPLSVQTRFLMKWKCRDVTRCYMAWRAYVDAEKKYRRVVRKFIGRINNGVACRVMEGWKGMVEVRGGRGAKRRADNVCVGNENRASSYFRTIHICLLCNHLQR